MNSTKQKIIDVAIQLFNQHGFKNVGLKQIAEQLSISNGHLNYHFKKKDDLIFYCYQQLDTELTQILARFKSFPDLAAILEQTTIFYHFQSKYGFFYLDILEICRAYPSIGSIFKEHFEHSLQHIEATFNYCVTRDIFQLEPFPKAYHQLAQTIWQQGVFWLTRQVILEQDTKDSKDFIQGIIGLCYPYLTEKGLLELKKAQKELAIYIKSTK